jgi:ABC-type multidrug transport system fused ATPase/permease subunit
MVVGAVFAAAGTGRGLRPEGAIRGRIELRNVNFGYPSQEQDLFYGLSLTVQPNESIAIMGPNGVVKSTLMDLLAGFLHPDQGEILLNGHDIRDFDLEYLRAQIGIVPQKGTLFDGSILENMTLYR